MSSKQIGNYSVKIAREFYTRMGYTVDIVEKTGKFRKFKDLYSEWFQTLHERDAGFDLLGISPTQKPVLIQVTTTTPKVHKDFQLFADYFGKMVSVQQYVRTKRGKFDKIFIYFPKQKKVKIEIK